MKKGWIKLHRSLLDWEWYSDSNVVRVFLHLLLRANHEDKKWKGTLIKRGQLVTGLYSLSEQTGLSVQEVRTSLSRLKSTSEITSQTTNRFSIITLLQWEKYQSKDSQQQANQQASQQTSNKQTTTNKNEKNVKKIKKGVPKWGLERLRNGDVTKELVKEFPRDLVQKEVANMIDWLEAKGKQYKNYLAFARKWVRNSKDKWQDGNLRRHNEQWAKKKADIKVELREGELVSLSELIKRK